MDAKKRIQFERLSPATNPVKENTKDALELAFVDHLEFSLAKDRFSATKRDLFKAAALSVRDRLIERWIETQQKHYEHDAKRVYYLSMEYLMGRSLINGLINLGIYDIMRDAVHELGFDIVDLSEMESDAALGNGGLGRLAACFMDSLATLSLPAYGYGIRYEYGIFSQKIHRGYQVESPDNWLRYGNPWEVERPEYIYMIKFFGRIYSYRDEGGNLRYRWVDTENIIAMAYDTMVPGYQNNTVNTLRLWSAKSVREFDFNYFNHGNYV